ncbi:MAG: formylglycine-generating enzyme family protein [Cellulomonas sp.]
MSPDHACCAPGAPHDSTPATVSLGVPTLSRDVAAAARASILASMVDVPGGVFAMGHDGSDGYPSDGEGPAHVVDVRPFRMMRTTVTNAQFASFVDATGYRTEAEAYGWSFVFAGLLPDDFPPTRGVAATPWWRQVEGADWRHPEGPHSDVRERDEHPVVHVSWSDASAFAAWAGVRLPTEAEWERAARGGREGAHYPWGHEREPGGEHLMNVWQGDFPSRNTLDDGYLGTAPAEAFPPNGFGLHTMTGNVWEWCQDWFAVDTYRSSAASNPTGPSTGESRVMRGGSYLCHESYCFRYRVDSRSSSSPDSSAGNVGFRCVADAVATPGRGGVAPVAGG